MVDKCFITVPAKPTEEANFQVPLKKALGTQYTKQSAENALFAIKELEGLRRNAVGRVLDKTHTSLEILNRYHDQLSSLENRIPAIAYQIPFKWCNAFDKGGLFSSQKCITQSSIGFEKICVLWNIAALESQIAANQNMESDDGLKIATTDFQKSAGTFQHIKDHVQSTIQQEPTLDLLQETLGAMVALMTAQAQEVFFFKATKEQMKDGVIVKIASQTADYYAAALKLMQKDNLRTCWDKDWMPIIECKAVGYLAIAEFHQSAVHKAAGQFGEELSREKASLDLLAQSKRIFDPARNPFRGTEPAVHHAYEAAKKDNDFIYHAIVPDVKGLDPIGRASFVKQTPPTFPMSHGFVEMFGPLVVAPADKGCTIC